MFDSWLITARGNSGGPRRADTFQQPVLLNPAGSSEQVTYNMTDKGIAWPGEADKYRVTSYTPDQIVPPPYWRARYPDGYTSDNIPDLTTDEHFQVWMRTAGLPTFRKLYFRNDNEDMAAGTYEIDVFMSGFIFIPPPRLPARVRASLGCSRSCELDKR